MNFFFRFGDLNYRIDLDRETVIRLIENRDLEALYKEDQLRKELENGNVFNYFKTFQPKFNPTYRYLRGSRQYDSEVKNSFQIV